MSDGSTNSDMHEKEVDPGEPIAGLAAFERDASTGLMSRIRRTIQRRTTAAQLTSFSLSVPFVVLKEFWLMLIEQLNPKDPRKDARHGGKTS